MYCAVIGDMINSRQILPEQREHIQVRLKQLLEEVNVKFSSYLASPFLITLGDEFQGLLTAAEPTLKIIESIDRGLAEYEVRVRYGIGLGKVNTRINREQALGDDGPAYHLARESVDFLKQEKWRGFPVAIRTGRTDTLLLQSICGLLNEMAETWSEAQRQYILDMELMKEQMLVATKNRVQQSSVSRALKRGHYQVYQQTKDSLKQYLLEVYDCQEDGGILSQYNHAVMLEQNRRYEEAISILQPILAEIPDAASGPPSYADAALVLGNCYSQSYQNEKAIDILGTALKREDERDIPRSTRIRLRNSLGDCYLSLTEQALADADVYNFAVRAGEILEEALQLCENEPLLEAQVRCDLAFAYEEQGNLERAVTCRVALQTWIHQTHLLDRDTEVTNLHNLSMVYEKQGQREKALDAARQAAQLAERQTMPEPGNGWVFLNYAVLLSEENAPRDQIIKQFEAALCCAKQDSDWDCTIQTCEYLEPLYIEKENQEAAEHCAGLRFQAEKKLKKAH